MSIETELKTLLNPLLAGGCHNVANVSTTITYPYAVFYEITAMPTHAVSGQLLATDRHYQVDVIARSPEQAKGLALGTVKQAIETSTVIGGVLTISMSGEYDEVAKTYQYITEYQVWEL